MIEANKNCRHTKTIFHTRGFKKSHKTITSFHLNSTNFNDSFKDNFKKKLKEKVKSTLVVLILSFASFMFFSSSFHLGAFSSCFLMASFSSLSVAPLVCNAASKLNHWDSSQKWCLLSIIYQNS